MLQPYRQCSHILAFTFRHVEKSCFRIHYLIAQYISYIVIIKKSALERNEKGNLVRTFKTESRTVEPSQRTTTRKGYSYAQYMKRVMT